MLHSPVFSTSSLEKFLNLHLNFSLLNGCFREMLHINKERFSSSDSGKKIPEVQLSTRKFWVSSIFSMSYKDKSSKIPNRQILRMPSVTSDHVGPMLLPF